MTAKPAIRYPEYHDHADDDVELLVPTTVAVKRKRDYDIKGSSTRRSSSGGPIEIFPMILHLLLEEAEARGHSSIANWQSHGRAFRIFDKKRFEKEVLPLYFEHQSMYNSFQRQLNSYGFHRLYKVGPDSKCYYHDMCLRGKPLLAALIQRNRVSSQSVRRRFDPSTEPDFSTMSPLPPSDVSIDKHARRVPSTSMMQKPDGIISSEQQNSAAPLFALEASCERPSNDDTNLSVTRSTHLRELACLGSHESFRKLSRDDSLPTASCEYSQIGGKANVRRRLLSTRVEGSESRETVANQSASRAEQLSRRFSFRSLSPENLQGDPSMTNNTLRLPPGLVASAATQAVHEHTRADSGVTLWQQNPRTSSNTTVQRHNSPAAPLQHGLKTTGLSDSEGSWHSLLSIHSVVNMTGGEGSSPESIPSQKSLHAAPRSTERLSTGSLALEPTVSSRSRVGRKMHASTSAASGGVSSVAPLRHLESALSESFFRNYPFNDTSVQLSDSSRMQMRRRQNGDDRCVVPVLSAQRNHLSTIENGNESSQYRMGHLMDGVIHHHEEILSTQGVSAMDTAASHGHQTEVSSIRVSVSNYLNLMTTKFDQVVEASLGDVVDPDTLSQHSCSSTL